MDPLSAVGLAAAVVQFTDFGARLLNDSIKIYRSADGQTSQHVQLATISQDLQELAVNIELKSKTLHQPGRPLEHTEGLLVRLCGECQEISSQLSNVLSRIKADRKSSSSIDLMKESVAAAIRTYRSESEITQLQQSLSEVRQQMMMISLTILWEKSAQQAGMRETLDRIDIATRNLNPTVVKSPQMEPSPANDGPESAIVNAIWNSTWTTTGSIASMMDSTSYVNAVRRFTKAGEGEIFDQQEADKFSTLSIINSLVFEKLNSREAAIPKAYESTFEWAFKEPSGDAQWTNFDQWLGDKGTQIYWITGKAGAGKSTLMKYLSSHPRTRARLEVWSKPLPLVIASFHFWIAGNSMEKSHEGLLQTILYQFLCQMPHLTPKVCPRRWALFKLFGNKALKVAPAWSFNELLESLSVVERYVGTEYNLCLFVDGLDEFDGDPGKLISFIKLFHARSGAKVCVSSRPWNAFSDAFRENPSLRVQDLTKNDMDTYVKAHFLSNQGFKELQQSSPIEAQQLMDQVVTKSEGIFLWLAVVVRSLMEGLTDGDRLSDLQQIVDSLPSDLSDLYKQIWLRIKQTEKPHFSRYFQIKKASLSVSSLDAVTLWLADEDLKAPELGVKSPGFERIQSIRQTMGRRLNGKTRGLLEITSRGYVDYLHRTVSDWVKSIWDDICAQSPSDFDPNLELLKATVAIGVKFNEMISINADRTIGKRRAMDLFKTCLGYASYTRDVGSNTPLLVACLDQLVRYLLRECYGSNLVHHKQNHLGVWEKLKVKLRYQIPLKQVCMFILGITGESYHIQQSLLGGDLLDNSLLRKVGLESEEEDRRSVLGCAIFGFNDEDDGPRGSSRNTQFGHAKRYEIVRLLLEHGVLKRSIEDSSRYFQRVGHDLGWDVYKRVRWNRLHAGPRPFKKLDGEECPDYWKAVQELYEGCPDFERWKRSRYLLYNSEWQ